MTTPNPEHRGRAEITNEPNNLFIINKNPRIEHTNMTDFALLCPISSHFNPNPPRRTHHRTPRSDLTQSHSPPHIPRSNYKCAIG